MIFPPTDWLDFVATEYDVGAPATSLSFERWFRNVVAAMQGSAGAPRLAPEALGSITAGDVVQIGLAAEQSFVEAGEVCRIGISQGGTIRVKLNLRHATAGVLDSGVSLIRRRNGSNTTLQTWTPSDTATDYSLDAAVIIGDELLISITSMPSGTVYIKNIAFCTDGEMLWPGIYNTGYLWGIA